MSSFSFFAIFISCVWVFLLVCLPVQHMCAWCFQRSEECMGFPGTGVRGGDELPGQCWELKPGPLEEHSVLLTTEQSLQFK